MKTKRFKKTMAFLLALCLSSSLLGGCGSQDTAEKTKGQKTETADGKKTFVFGDTTFNPENEEADVNPHNKSLKNKENEK